MMATESEERFLASQGIAVEDALDATGLPTWLFKEIMRINRQIVAYGTSECAEGHTVRTRAGHCAVCNPARIRFTQRWTQAGFVYICTSDSTGLLKVGFSTDCDKRVRALNAVSYGGANDWDLGFTHETTAGGTLENAVQQKLSEYRVDGEYRRDGHAVQCYELFRCSFWTAMAALFESAA